MFTGRNIEKGLSDRLASVVAFLNEKAAAGEFEYSDSFDYWTDHEDIIEPLGLGIEAGELYFAVGLAYMASKNDGQVEIPEDAHIWRWAWSLHILAAEAGWEAEYFVRVVKSLYSKKDDVDTMMGGAVQVYARHNFDCGQALIEKLPQYKFRILAGLTECDFKKYSSIYPPKDNQEEFALMFSHVYDIQGDTPNMIYDAANDFTDFSSPAALAFLLKIHDIVENERRTGCEEKVRALLQGGNTNTYGEAVTNWCLRTRGQDTFAEECVLALIDGLGKEDKSVLRMIDHSTYPRHKEVEYLDKILMRVAERFSPIVMLKMTDSLHHLSDSKEHFMNFTLSFVLHPDGIYRVAGRRLWDEHHLESSEFNVADLEEPLQCLFIISMLQDYGNPETRLPKIIPLIKSGSEQTKNILMRFLRPYTDDYMGHVSNALDSLGIECEEATTIKNYVEYRQKAIEERTKIKELSPFCAQYGAYKEALRVEREYMQEQMKSTEEKHRPIWKEFAREVVLARGERWQMPDGTTQKLPRISFSMPSRMLAEAFTPMEKQRWLTDIMKDWNDTKGNH